MKIIDLVKSLNKIVPKNIALSFDNVGLLIGDYEDEVKGIYVSLDINNEIINYAIDNNINTIISHHPIIFNPMKEIVNSNNVQNKVRKCISNNINIISFHTNLDAIVGGMNEYLVDFLCFDYKKIEILEINPINSKCGIGRILTLKDPLEYVHVIDKVKGKFNLDKLRCVNSNKNIIKRICIINGSGNSMVRNCFNKDIDLIITGDITYHTAFDAIENGVNIIDVGHFTSENLIYNNVMKNILYDLNLNLNIQYDTILKDVYTYM